jgi:hypothetical protein
VHTRILKFGLITSYQIGDLNVDLLRENNNKLLEIISEFNLTNVIKEHTRNDALLDPILVFNLDIVTELVL